MALIDYSNRSAGEVYEDTVTEVFEIDENTTAEYEWCNSHDMPGEIRVNDEVVDAEASAIDWEAFMAQYPEGSRLRPIW